MNRSAGADPSDRRGERRSALEIAITASSWPITLLFSSSSILRSFSVSFCSIRCNGTPVTFEMMCIMSSPVTSTSLSSRSSPPLRQEWCRAFPWFVFPCLAAQPLSRNPAL